jgi:hypothetical protein
VDDRGVGTPGVQRRRRRAGQRDQPARPAARQQRGGYYHGELRADDLRALGFEGTVGEPGEWGRLANGGARLTVAGQRVDLFYRDLDAVGCWLEQAQAGSYEVDRVEGYLAGMTSYVLVGELALAEVLAGELPRP